MMYPSSIFHPYDGGRTKEEKDRNVKARTSDENLVAQVIAIDLGERFNKPVSIWWNGVDNTGDPLPPGVTATRDPDWMIQVGNDFREVEAMVHWRGPVNNPTRQFCTNTVKVNKLCYCSFHHAAIFIVRDDFYTILQPRTCEYLFKNYVWTYPKKWGYKPCVCLHDNQMADLISRNKKDPGYIELRHYTPGALEEMKRRWPHRQGSRD